MKNYVTDTPGVRARLRQFEVFEVPKHIPDGQGDWYWVLFEKEGRSTYEAVGEIANTLKIDRKDVGYAGLKDKHAKTIQWVSVPVKPENFPFRKFVAIRNRGKLRIGVLWGNWFRIVLESAKPGKVVNAFERLERIPNGFGPQRFGRNNVEIGRLLVLGRKKEAMALMRKFRIPFEKRFFIFLVDSYTSYLFNRVLDRRIHAPELDGDLNGKFGPTGPIFGRKMPFPTGVAGEMEKDILQEEGINLSMFRGKGRRRALFVPLIGKNVKINGNKVELKFFLPKGSYATMVLREITKEHFSGLFPSSSCGSS